MSLPLCSHHLIEPHLVCSSTPPEVRVKVRVTYDWSKTRDALLPFRFNFYLEYAIQKVQEHQVGLNLNVTHQLLGYAHDLNLLGSNINALKKNIEAVIDTSKEAGLEVNTEKNKYILLSRHQNAGQNCNIMSRVWWYT
jgi:hypothetical protein